MQRHPLDSCVGLLPPDRQYDAAGWRKYHGIAQSHLNKLEHYAANERRQTGTTSAATDDLLDEFRSTVTWSRGELELAELSESDPERFLSVINAKADLEYKLHRAAWRKTVNQNPEWLKDRMAGKPGTFRHESRGLTSQVLNELASEQFDPMKFLQADHRTEEEILNDALADALVEAELEEMAAPDKSNADLQQEATLVELEFLAG